MPPPLDLITEGRILQLISDNWSAPRIQNHLLKSSISVSVSLIQKIRQERGKRRAARKDGIKFRVDRAKWVRTPEMIEKVRNAFSRKNPPFQEKFSNNNQLTPRSLRRILYDDLNQKKIKKRRTFNLNEAQKENRAKNGAKMKTVMMSKRDFVTTLDEAIFRYIPGSGENPICYIPKKETIPADWVRAVNEAFPKSFMAVAAICNRGPVMLKRIPKGTKSPLTCANGFMMTGLDDLIS